MIKYAVNKNVAEMRKRRLLALVRNPVHTVRYGAAKRLAMMKSKGVNTILRAMLADSHPDVRVGAIEALVKRNASEAIGQIEGLLRNPNEAAVVLRGALWALGKLRSRRSIPAIEGFLRHENPYVRGSALKALAALGSRKSVAKIKGLLTDPEESVRQEAAFAINSITPSAQAELYQENILNPAFTAGKEVVEARQRKSGSQTILLGGKLFGKESRRIISEEAYALWAKALRNGIPVEPILEEPVKSRAGDGLVEVRTGVIPGPSVKAFLMREANKKYELGIRRQIRAIEKALEAIGINHSHLHERNYIVLLGKVRGKLKPKVYVIDFDSAREKD